jgi:hypothetical protein
VDACRPDKALCMLMNIYIFKVTSVLFICIDVNWSSFLRTMIPTYRGFKGKGTSYLPEGGLHEV